MISFYMSNVFLTKFLLKWAIDMFLSLVIYAVFEYLLYRWLFRKSG